MYAVKSAATLGTLYAVKGVATLVIKLGHKRCYISILYAVNSAATLVHYSNVQLIHRSTVPQIIRFNPLNRFTVQLLHRSTVQLFHRSTDPQFNRLNSFHRSLP